MCVIFGGPGVYAVLLSLRCCCLLCCLGGGNMSLLADAVLGCWYIGYVVPEAPLPEEPCRVQLIVLILPVLMCLM